VDIPMKIRLAQTYAKISASEMCRRYGTSPQAFSQRMETGKFSTAELEKIAECCGAKFVCYFEFPDGTKI